MSHPNETSSHKAGDILWDRFNYIYNYISPKSLLNIAYAFVILISASPYIGIASAGTWFTWIICLIIADEVIARILKGPVRSTAHVIIEMCIVSAFCLIGLNLMTGFEGAAQILGMAAIALVFAQKVVVETLGPVRFWVNVTPPLLAAGYFQIWSAVQNAKAGHLHLVVTDLANLVLLLLIFMVIRTAVRNRREQWRKANAEVTASAMSAREAHKIAMLAEQLAGSGHFRIDLKTGVSTFSDGLYEIYRFDRRRETLSTLTIVRLYSRSERAKLYRMISEVSQTQKLVRVETRCRLRDGRERVILTQISPEISARGETFAFLGVSMDITETRAREAEVASSEARFRLLADHVTDLVLWISAGGRILYASPSVEALGYTPEAMVGQPLADYILPADYGSATRLLNRVFDDDPTDMDLTGEFRFVTRRSEAKEVWLEGFARAVRDPKGRPRSAVFNFRDVTRRRELEEDLRQAKARAEAATEAKSDFLANMSHEVRTPLTGVIGFSTLLAQMPDLPPQAEVYVGRVMASGEALLSVVNDILDFSKLEAGQLDLDPAPFPLEGFLEDVVGLFSAQAEAKGLRIELDVADPVPAQILADRGRLQQVLANLLSNAIKFTDQGGIRVQARYAPEREELQVAVSDTGIGISAGVAERLFQRFTQADGSISRRYGGTGLGLSICRQLTELMGGGIEVISAPGAGSTFIFKVLAPPVEAAAGPAPVTEVALNEEKLSILVVDDLEANRELVRALLRAAGQDQLEEASNGPEAISMAVRRSYDIILMDLQMPGMDGFAASRAIRQLSKENHNTPIIALSANVLAEHIDEAQQAGMNDHVGKPIVPARLFAVLNRWAGVRVGSPAGRDAAQARAG